MAKKLRDEDLNLNIIVNGDKAKKELGDLEKSTRDLINSNKELRTEKQRLERAGKQESDRYKEITAEMRENNRAIKTNETRMKELRSEIGLTGLTMKQLRTEQQRLKRLMDSTTPGTAQWKQYRAELDKVEAQMKKVRTNGQMMKMSIGSIADGFNRFAALGASVIATLTGIAFSVRNLITGMVDLDDQLANVMKTTGLTSTQVRELYGDLKTLNTRTPRRELLLLAEEAGRLGYSAREDIMDFVEVANQIKVALGDDLGGEAEVAIREVGKLTEIYKVGEQYGTGFRDSMLKVGSAINEVSANSNAQAPFMIDYLKRMGGIAVQADINAASIIGYASTLDQLGQTQEMSATAHGKVMVDMFKDSDKYARIARISAAEFSDLLNTDANEAFIRMLEGLNGNNEGMAVMAKRLDELGIDGARAVQVMSALAANTDKIRTEQELANKAMDEGISLTNEYNIKNNNLAAGYQKIGQYLRAAFINSNVLGWLEKIVGKVAEWTEIPLSKTLREEQTELNLLVASITNANNTQETRNTLIGELQEAYPDFLGNLDAEKVTNEQLAERLREVNEQYENRILLAVKEEALEENYKQRMDLKLEELRIIKEIAKYEQIANEAREKAANVTDPSKFRALLSDEEIAALNAMDLLPKRLQNVRSEFQGLLNDEMELNTAIRQLMTGNPNPGGGGTGGSGGGGGGTGGAGGGAGGEGMVTAPDVEIDTWETMYYDANILAHAEMLAAKKASEEEWTEFFKQQVKEREDALALELELEQEIEEARADLKEMRLAAISDIAGSLANMFESGSALQIAMFAIQKALAIAEVWVNYAREKSAISLAARKMDAIVPGTGMAWGAAMQAKALFAAKANTGIIAAQAVAQAVGSTKKGKKTGGFTDRDQSDNEVVDFVHANEWVASAPAVRNPTVRRFIDIFQHAQETGNIHRLDMNAILAALPGRMPGKQSGGYTAGTSPVPVSPILPNPTRSPETASDPVLLDKLDQLVDRVENLKIYASIDTIERERNKYLKIQGTRGL